MDNQNQQITTSPQFDQFLEKIKQEKTEEEITKLLAALYTFQAEALYDVMLEVFSDQDLEVLEKIENEQQAEEEINRKFKEKTHMTPEEFIGKLRDALSNAYLENKKAA